MHVLVAYASRHGSTEGIAERIAETLLVAGLDAEAHPAGAVRNLGEYDAFVIGSAAYMFHWLKDATELVRRNRNLLATRPVWLFSSGPVGTDQVDADGRDVRVTSIPKEIPELSAAVGARDHRVFFGAYDAHRKPVGLAERFLALMPSVPEDLPQGDFRDWPEIEAWADQIAATLLADPAPSPAAAR